MAYDIVIGLETHIELNTKTKVFCGCKNEFGGEPNTHCCPVCIGLPGSLPRVNAEAVKKAITMGLITNCEISKTFAFDRKHYFYPDLSKSYQITQDRTPICRDGYLEITGKDGAPKRIRIHQIHLEEDAGKLIHSASGETYVDYNRGGVPLIEIVSEPDMSSVEEALEYVTTLKELAKFSGVSDVKMEQGSLRCDVNVSLKPAGASEYGVKVEMKNINSFKAIERAIKYEVARQTRLLEMGETILPETRRWDDLAGENYAMRSKEGAKDYRYMPEPDILPTTITDAEIDEIKNNIPMLPREIKSRLVTEYGLGDYDANLISKEGEISKFFFDAVNYYTNPKKVANWITSEINKRINNEFMEEIIVPINAKEFGVMLTMLDKGELSQQGARTILNELWGNDETTIQIVERLSLKMESNDEELEDLIKKIIAENEKCVADYKGGNQKAFAFFVGQVMKATRGQANAGKVNELLLKHLS